MEDETPIANYKSAPIYECCKWMATRTGYNITKVICVRGITIWRTTKYI